MTDQLDNEPLPPVRGRDCICLLSQSPQRLHLYWRYSRDPLKSLRRMFPAQTEQYKLKISLFNQESQTISSFEIAPGIGDGWFDVQPGQLYRADIGLGRLSETRPFIPLLSSGPAWQFAEPARTLARNPTASDLLEALTMADDETQNLAAHAVAEGFSSVDLMSRSRDGEVKALSDDEQAQLRHLLVHLAFGTSYKELDLLVEFHQLILGWLGRTSVHNRWNSEKDKYEFDAKRLYNVLCSMCEIENSDAPSGFHEVATHHVESATNASSKPQTSRVWLPSMTPDLDPRLAYERR